MTKKEYDANRYKEQREKLLAQTTKYQKDNRIVCTKRQREWSMNNRERLTNNRLKSRFGITLEQYNEMLTKQNGVCAICKQAETHIDKRVNRPRNLAVDHNHITGKVRGLLCFDCNAALGKFNESIELINRAINYLG